MDESDRREAMADRAQELAQALDGLGQTLEELLEELAPSASWCSCHSGELSSMCCESETGYWTWRSRRKKRENGSSDKVTDRG